MFTWSTVLKADYQFSAIRTLILVKPRKTFGLVLTNLLFLTDTFSEGFCTSGLTLINFLSTFEACSCSSSSSSSSDDSSYKEIKWKISGHKYYKNDITFVFWFYIATTLYYHPQELARINTNTKNLLDCMEPWAQLSFGEVLCLGYKHINSFLGQMADFFF